MSNTEEKLPERPGRTRPRPAPTAGTDPVDHTIDQSFAAAPPVSTPVKKATRRGEATVQVATRVSEEVASIIDRTAASEGMTKREVIERAVRLTWGR